MKCIVCGEDKAPDVHFDVPVICSDCARLQLQRMTEMIEDSREVEAQSDST